MITGLIYNISLLLSLAVLHYIFGLKQIDKYSGSRKLLMGIFIGIIGIVVMYTDWMLKPGYLLDSRTILLSVSGLIVGPVSTIIGMVIIGGVRIYMGGDGWMSGLAIILLSGTIGILWRLYRPDWRKKNKYMELVLMGFITHLAMLACVILIPIDSRAEVIMILIPLILTIYPIGTLLLGAVMLINIERHESLRVIDDIEGRLNSFFNASKELAYIKDNNLRYIEINESMLRYFDLKREEVIGKSLEDLKDRLKYPLDIENINKGDIEVLKEKRYYYEEERVGIKVFESTKFPLKLKSGEYGIGGIIRDLTQVAKKNEMQEAILNISRSTYTHDSLKSFLANIHIQLKRIISAENTFIALYDSESGQYTLPYFEDEYDIITDGTELLSLEGSLTDYVRRSGSAKIINRVNEAEIRDSGEIFNAYGTDSFVWMGAPLFSADSKEVIGVIAVQDYHNHLAYDIDELALLEIFASNIGVFIDKIKKVEDLKNTIIKAEESDRLKSAFLANISHEIRTPMNGIMGFTNLLLDDITEPKQREYLNIISKSSERLLATINDILDLSRIESGTITIAKERFDLNFLIEEIFDFFNKSAKRLHFHTSVSGKSVPLYIYTDRVRLSQVLINLMRNAVKFTKEGSVKIGYFIKEGLVAIYVKDTGIGIPDDKIDMVFERFTQIHTSMLNEFEGSGLGLPISKFIVESLGGKIRVRSKEERGSIFYVELPIN